MASSPAYDANFLSLNELETLVFTDERMKDMMSLFGSNDERHHFFKVLYQHIELERSFQESLIFKFANANKCLQEYRDYLSRILKLSSAQIDCHSNFNHVEAMSALVKLKGILSEFGCPNDDLHQLDLFHIGSVGNFKALAECTKQLRQFDRIELIERLMHLLNVEIEQPQELRLRTQGQSSCVSKQQSPARHDITPVTALPVSLNFPNDYISELLKPTVISVGTKTSVSATVISMDEDNWYLVDSLTEHAIPYILALNLTFSHPQNLRLLHRILSTMTRPSHPETVNLVLAHLTLSQAKAKSSTNPVPSQHPVQNDTFLHDDGDHQFMANFGELPIHFLLSHAQLMDIRQRYPSILSSIVYIQMVIASWLPLQFQTLQQGMVLVHSNTEPPSSPLIPAYVTRPQHPVVYFTEKEFHLALAGTSLPSYYITAISFYQKSVDLLREAKNYDRQLNPYYLTMIAMMLAYSAKQNIYLAFYFEHFITKGDIIYRFHNDSDKRSYNAHQTNTSYILPQSFPVLTREHPVLRKALHTLGLIQDGCGRSKHPHHILEFLDAAAPELFPTITDFAPVINDYLLTIFMSPKVKSYDAYKKYVELDHLQELFYSAKILHSGVTLTYSLDAPIGPVFLEAVDSPACSQGVEGRQSLSSQQTSCASFQVALTHDTQHLLQGMNIARPHKTGITSEEQSQSHHSGTPKSTVGYINTVSNESISDISIATPATSMEEVGSKMILHSQKDKFAIPSTWKTTPFIRLVGSPCPGPHWGGKADRLGQSLTARFLLQNIDNLAIQVFALNSFDYYSTLLFQSHNLIKGQSHQNATPGASEHLRRLYHLLNSDIDVEVDIDGILPHIATNVDIKELRNSAKLLPFSQFQFDFTCQLHPETPSSSPARGTYLIQCTANNAPSLRTIVRHGGMNVHQQHTSTGVVFRVYDETGDPVPSAIIHVLHDIAHMSTSSHQLIHNSPHTASTSAQYQQFSASTFADGAPIHEEGIFVPYSALSALMIPYVLVSLPDGSTDNVFTTAVPISPSAALPGLVHPPDLRRGGSDVFSSSQPQLTLDCRYFVSLESLGSLTHNGEQHALTSENKDPIEVTVSSAQMAADNTSQSSKLLFSHFFHPITGSFLHPEAPSKRSSSSLSLSSSYSSLIPSSSHLHQNKLPRNAIPQELTASNDHGLICNNFYGAEVVVFPQLSLNGQPVDPSVYTIHQSKLIITASPIDDEDTILTDTIENFNLFNHIQHQGKDVPDVIQPHQSVHHFTVPQCLSSLKFHVELVVTQSSRSPRFGPKASHVDTCAQPEVLTSTYSVTVGRLNKSYFSSGQLLLRREANQYVVYSVDKTGSPLPNVHIVVQLQTSYVQRVSTIYGQTDGEGRFVLGPLIGGRRLVCTVYNPPSQRYYTPSHLDLDDELTKWRVNPAYDLTLDPSPIHGALTYSLVPYNQVKWAPAMTVILPSQSSDGQPNTERGKYLYLPLPSDDQYNFYVHRLYADLYSLTKPSHHLVEPSSRPALTRKASSSLSEEQGYTNLTLYEPKMVNTRNSYRELFKSTARIELLEMNALSIRDSATHAVSFHPRLNCFMIDLEALNPNSLYRLSFLNEWTQHTTLLTTFSAPPTREGVQSQSSVIAPTSSPALMEKRLQSGGVSKLFRRIRSKADDKRPLGSSEEPGVDDAESNGYPGASHGSVLDAYQCNSIVFNRKGNSLLFTIFGILSMNPIPNSCNAQQCFHPGGSSVSMEGLQPFLGRATLSMPSITTTIMNQQDDFSQLDSTSHISPRRTSMSADMTALIGSSSLDITVCNPTPQAHVFVYCSNLTQSMDHFIACFANQPAPQASVVSLRRFGGAEPAVEDQQRNQPLCDSYLGAASAFNGQVKSTSAIHHHHAHNIALLEASMRQNQTQTVTSAARLFSSRLNKDRVADTTPPTSASLFQGSQNAGFPSGLAISTPHANMLSYSVFPFAQQAGSAPELSQTKIDIAARKRYFQSEELHFDVGTLLPHPSLIVCPQSDASPAIDSASFSDGIVPSSAVELVDPHVQDAPEQPFKAADREAALTSSRELQHDLTFISPDIMKRRSALMLSIPLSASSQTQHGQMYKNDLGVISISRPDFHHYANITVIVTNGSCVADVITIDNFAHVKHSTSGASLASLATSFIMDPKALLPHLGNFLKPNIFTPSHSLQKTPCYSSRRIDILSSEHITILGPRNNIEYEIVSNHQELYTMVSHHLSFLSTILSKNALTTATLSSTVHGLQSFAFITLWHYYDLQLKHLYYQQFMSHELHLFLFSNDRLYFERYCRLNIATKHSYSVIDLWLLCQPLLPESIYLNPSKDAQSVRSSADISSSSFAASNSKRSDSDMTDQLLLQPHGQLSRPDYDYLEQLRSVARSRLVAISQDLSLYNVCEIIMTLAIVNPSILRQVALFARKKYCHTDNGLYYTTNASQPDKPSGTHDVPSSMLSTYNLLTQSFDQLLALKQFKLSTVSESDDPVIGGRVCGPGHRSATDMSTISSNAPLLKMQSPHSPYIPEGFCPVEVAERQWYTPTAESASITTDSFQIGHVSWSLFWVDFALFLATPSEQGETGAAATPSSFVSSHILTTCTPHSSLTEVLLGLVLTQFPPQSALSTNPSVLLGSQLLAKAKSSKSLKIRWAEPSSPQSSIITSDNIGDLASIIGENQNIPYLVISSRSKQQTPEGKGPTHVPFLLFHKQLQVLPLPMPSATSHTSTIPVSVSQYYIDILASYHHRRQVYASDPTLLGFSRPYLCRVIVNNQSNDCVNVDVLVQPPQNSTPMKYWHHDPILGMHANDQDHRHRHTGLDYLLSYQTVNLTIPAYTSHMITYAFMLSPFVMATSETSVDPSHPGIREFYHAGAIVTTSPSGSSRSIKASQSSFTTTSRRDMVHKPLLPYNATIPKHWIDPFLASYRRTGHLGRQPDPSSNSKQLTSTLATCGYYNRPSVALITSHPAVTLRAVPLSLGDVGVSSPSPRLMRNLDRELHAVIEQGSDAEVLDLLYDIYVYGSAGLDDDGDDDDDDDGDDDHGDDLETHDEVSRLSIQQSTAGDDPVELLYLFAAPPIKPTSPPPSAPIHPHNILFELPLLFHRFHAPPDAPRAEVLSRLSFYCQVISLLKPYIITHLQQDPHLYDLLSYAWRFMRIILAFSVASAAPGTNLASVEKRPSENWSRGQMSPSLSTSYRTMKGSRLSSTTDDSSQNLETMTVPGVNTLHTPTVEQMSVLCSCMVLHLGNYIRTKIQLKPAHEAGIHHQPLYSELVPQIIPRLHSPLHLGSYSDGQVRSMCADQYREFLRHTLLRTTTTSALALNDIMPLVISSFTLNHKHRAVRLLLSYITAQSLPPPPQPISQSDSSRGDYKVHTNSAQSVESRPTATTISNPNRIESSSLLSVVQSSRAELRNAHSHPTPCRLQLAYILVYIDVLLSGKLASMMQPRQLQWIEHALCLQNKLSNNQQSDCQQEQHTSPLSSPDISLHQRTSSLPLFLIATTIVSTYKHIAPPNWSRLFGSCEEYLSLGTAMSTFDTGDAVLEASASAPCPTPIHQPNSPLLQAQNHPSLEVSISHQLAGSQIHIECRNLRDVTQDNASLILELRFVDAELLLSNEPFSQPSSHSSRVFDDRDGTKTCLQPRGSVLPHLSWALPLKPSAVDHTATSPIVLNCFVPALIATNSQLTVIAPSSNLHVTTPVMFTEYDVTFESSSFVPGCNVLQVKHRTSGKHLPGVYIKCYGLKASARSEQESSVQLDPPHVYIVDGLTDVCGWFHFRQYSNPIGHPLVGPPHHYSCTDSISTYAFVLSHPHLGSTVVYYQHPPPSPL